MSTGTDQRVLLAQKFLEQMVSNQTEACAKTLSQLSGLSPSGSNPEVKTIETLCKHMTAQPTQNQTQAENSVNPYYKEEYFSWQTSIGEFGGIADRFKFEPFIKAEDTVLDFGCGGGYMLANLNCKRRIGLEVNQAARQEAQRRIEVYAELKQIPVQVDCIISHHALEHVDNPLFELSQLIQVLKPSGLCVFVTPYEDKSQQWNPADINKHLYTWAPLNMGNLFSRAGFIVESCEIIQHTWPDDYKEFVSKYGWQAFHQRCQEYSKQTGINQVRVVARKP